jgi:hypothetical protein
MDAGIASSPPIASCHHPKEQQQIEEAGVVAAVLLCELDTWRKSIDRFA